MPGVVFLFSQFSPIRIIVFDKNILYPIENIYTPYFSSVFLLYSVGLKNAKLAMFWTKLCGLTMIFIMMRA